MLHKPPSARALFLPLQGASVTPDLQPWALYISLFGLYAAQSKAARSKGKRILLRHAVPASRRPPGLACVHAQDDVHAPAAEHILRRRVDGAAQQLRCTLILGVGHTVSHRGMRVEKRARWPPQARD